MLHFNFKGGAEASLRSSPQKPALTLRILQLWDTVELLTHSSHTPHRPRTQTPVDRQPNAVSAGPWFQQLAALMAKDAFSRRAC